MPPGKRGRSSLGAYCNRRGLANEAFCFQLRAKRNPHMGGRLNFGGQIVGGGNNRAKVREQSLTVGAFRNVLARGFGKRCEPLLFEHVRNVATDHPATHATLHGIIHGISIPHCNRIATAFHRATPHYSRAARLKLFLDPAHPAISIILSQSPSVACALAACRSSRACWRISSCNNSRNRVRALCS